MPSDASPSTLFALGTKGYSHLCWYDQSYHALEALVWMDIVICACVLTFIGRSSDGPKTYSHVQMIILIMRSYEGAHDFFTYWRKRQMAEPCAYHQTRRCTRWTDIDNQIWSHSVLLLAFVFRTVSLIAIMDIFRMWASAIRLSAECM